MEPDGNRRIKVLWKATRNKRRMRFVRDANGWFHFQVWLADGGWSNLSDRFVDISWDKSGGTYLAEIEEALGESWGKK